MAKKNSMRDELLSATQDAHVIALHYDRLILHDGHQPYVHEPHAKELVDCKHKVCARRVKLLGLSKEGQQ